MGFGIQASIQGAKAKELQLEVLANNIANVQTVGFKEIGLSFTNELNGASTVDPDNPLLNGTSISSTNTINLLQGSIYKTDNPTDVALQGDGFFEVQTRNGTRYTRNGHFAVDKDLNLITQQGDKVMGADGPITIEQGRSVVIGPKGDISVDNEVVGQLKVVSFSDTKKLKLQGANYFSSEGASPQETANFAIAQGYLESSNVNMVHNLTQIIEVSRSYEAHQKSISKQYEATKTLNQIANNI